MEELYEIPKMYDSNGIELKEGDICICTPGSIATKPYKIKIVSEYEDNLYHNNIRVKTPYLCTELLHGGIGYKAVLWPYLSKRLTIVK